MEDRRRKHLAILTIDKPEWDKGKGDERRRVGKNGGFEELNLRTR
jgi:hypothetical protein